MRRVAPSVVALLLALTACQSSSAESPAVTTSAGSAADAEVYADAEARMATPTPPASGAPPATAPTTAAPPAERAPVVDLTATLAEATAYAEARGITVGIAVLDRESGALVTNGVTADEQMWSASVAKLFIADDLLHRDSTGAITLTETDRENIRLMLESSDDGAADTLYYAYGTEDMVTRVAERYDLPGITASNDPGEWELTDVSARAVARWYAEFLERAPVGDRDLVVDGLLAAMPTAADGFDQTFGLPSVVPDQPLAYKQGWMCCPATTSFLHTTGLVGADQRYVVALLTDRSATSGYAIDDVTRITEIAFPAGSFPG